MSQVSEQIQQTHKPKPSLAGAGASAAMKGGASALQAWGGTIAQGGLPAALAPHQGPRAPVGNAIRQPALGAGNQNPLAMWADSVSPLQKSTNPAAVKYPVAPVLQGGDDPAPYPVEQVYPSDFIGPLAKGQTRDKQVTTPSEALSVKDYLKLVGNVEQYYKDQAKQSHQTYDSNQAVSGLRAIYGYEGGKWDRMIPDAPGIKPPCDVQGQGDGNSQKADPATCDPMKSVIDQMFTMTKNDKGEMVRGEARLVRLPNGDLVDPGHLYTGIDSQLHSRADDSISRYGIDNRDGSTWSGDVGSAIVRDKEEDGKLTHQQAFDKYSGIPDLNSDLDGYNLGKSYDTGRSLTEQLSSYYQPPENQCTANDYRSRYSHFTSNAGLGTQNGKLTNAAKDHVRGEVDSFAELYGRRNSTWDAGWGMVFGSDDFDPNDERSRALTDRFTGYLETGLASEAQNYK